MICILCCAKPPNPEYARVTVKESVSAKRVHAEVKPIRLDKSAQINYGRQERPSEKNQIKSDFLP